MMEEPHDSGLPGARCADRERSRAELVVRRLLEEGFNQGKLAVVDYLVAAHMREHQMREAGHPAGPAGVKAVISSLRNAFPDFRLSIQDLAVAGEVVWTRNMATGTHLGPFRGRRPTGRPIAITVFDVMRIVNGRIVDHWGLPDHATLMSQIGPDGVRLSGTSSSNVL